jgi:hypothetical protein
VILSTFWELHGETLWVLLITIFITVVPGFLFYWLTVRPKRFSWEVISINPIIQADLSSDLSLEVFLADVKIKNPNIIVMRFGNTGRKNIRSEDFDGPVTLIFPEDVVRTINHPRGDRDFSYDLEYEDPVVQIKPKLIQRNEYTDFQFITDGELAAPDVKLRFDGKASEILVSGAKIIRRRQILYAFAAAIVGVMMVLLFFVYVPFLQAILLMIPLVVLGIVGLLILWADRRILTRWEPRHGFRAAIKKIVVEAKELTEKPGL